MWKLHDFSDPQILRETNIREFRCPKTPIFTHSKALNFDFNGFLNFLKAELYPNQKFRAPGIANMAFFELLHLLKLISRKNLSDRKMLNFLHIVEISKISYHSDFT